MKRFFRSKAMTGVLFLLAVALLMTGSIGGTRAALSIQSGIYQSQMELSDIGASLTENSKVHTTVASRDFDNQNRVWSTTYGNVIETVVKDAGDTAFKIGKLYPVEFGVKNTGTIPQYTRVTIYRYWVDANGQKIDDYGWFNGDGAKKLNRDPKQIEIYRNGAKIDEVAPAGWSIDNAPSESGERIVLYYTANGGVLQADSSGGRNGEEVIFADAIRVNSDITKVVAASEKEVGQDGRTRVTYTYAYDGLGFVVDITVDAVQTHNAADAMTSAWGHVNLG